MGAISPKTAKNPYGQEGRDSKQARREDLRRHLRRQGAESLLLQLAASAKWLWAQSCIPKQLRSGAGEGFPVKPPLLGSRHLQLFPIPGAPSLSQVPTEQPPTHRLIRPPLPK